MSGQPAWAHVDVQPRVVELGVTTELRVELPRLRAGAPPERLEAEAAGIEIVSSELVGASGPETLWTVRVRASGGPRQEPLVLRAVFADGESVEVDDTLTLVPAEDAASFPWAAAAVGGLLAVGFAAVALRAARRKA